MRCLLPLLAMGGSVLSAQTAVVVPPGSGSLQLLEHPEPIYPAIARSARVNGTVILQVEIATDGSVQNAKVVSGPPMLVGAALDCVKRWKYAPVLVDGKAMLVSTLVSIPFFLSKASPSAASGPEAGKDCLAAVSSNSAPSQQVDLCRQAALVMDMPAYKTNFELQRLTFMYASTAYRHAKQYPEAITYADRALEAAEKNTHGQSGVAGAYDARAQAEAESGDLQGASDDLSKAEDLSQSFLTDMKKAGHQDGVPFFLPSMKSRLLYHAQILKALGRPTEAAAKSEQASQL